MTLSDQVTDFLAKKHRKSAATYEQYRFILERVLLPWALSAGLQSAGDFTDADLEAFLSHLELRQHNGKPLAVASIRTYLRGVRVFLSACKVPKGDFEPPKQPRRLVSTLSRQEIDLLERVADTERDRLIVRVLADTGIRVSELLGLTLGDLRENSHDREYFIEVIGKGDKQREIGVPADTFKRLKSHAKDGGGGFIFQNHGRTARLTRHGVDKMIRGLAKKANISKRVYPHLMRHSFATQQIRAGQMSLIELQRALGHSTLAMLSQVYAHTTAHDAYSKQMAGLK
jgi:integrase/recombinase XerD